jgi:hypothetical protein
MEYPMQIKNVLIVMAIIMDNSLVPKLSNLLQTTNNIAKLLVLNVKQSILKIKDPFSLFSIA